MKLDNMFKKTRRPSGRKGHIGGKRRSPEVPEGLLCKCNKCQKAIITEDVIAGGYICPKCHGYFRMPAPERISSIVDADTFEEWDDGLENTNPLGYKSYPEKVEALKETTGLDEAVVTGKAVIDGMPTALGVCDGRFLMASMGEVVGEKITRMVERATEEKLPIIIFTCSGGARMQEGIVSLMQMAKTSAALKRHSDAGLLYVTVLTDPTTGGVTASFAMLGDIILAEPGALIGFAGPRVIEQTIGQKLPKGFQRAEFLKEHGFVDQIVERHQMREILGKILKMHQSRKWGEVEELTGQIFAGNINNIEETDEFQPEKIISLQSTKQVEAIQDIEETEKAQKAEYIGTGNRKDAEETKKCQAEKQEIEQVSAWDRVQISRRKDRPVATDYIEVLFPDFAEMHGDRYFADDAAIIGGIATFHGRAVTVIAQAKGRDTKENIKRNFGMPSPEGYRKALRLMKQAEKFHRPVICFVDTPGAFCGISAEERGQGEAIARNLYEMSALQTPILSIVIGEGGSGGALAMAASDEVWMLENSIYSILSPEGFASILWKDSTKAAEAAKVMRLTAADLKEMGIVEKVFEEPGHFTVDTMSDVVNELEESIEEYLEEYESKDIQEVVNQRYERFRSM